MALYISKSKNENYWRVLLTVTVDGKRGGRWQSLISRNRRMKTAQESCWLWRSMARQVGKVAELDISKSKNKNGWRVLLGLRGLFFMFWWTQREKVKPGGREAGNLSLLFTPPNSSIHSLSLTLHPLSMQQLPSTHSTSLSLYRYRSPPIH